MISSSNGTQAKWIMCERRPYWSAAFRRCQSSQVELHEVRSAATCWDVLAQFPASVVVWELSMVSFEVLVESLTRQRRWYPDSCPLVVGHRSEAGKQWLLREAGAVHAAFSLRHVPQLARIAQRHLNRQPTSTDWPAQVSEFVPPKE